MSTDLYDLMGSSSSSSNCCGARVTMQGLCADCGEHCTDESEEGPADEQLSASAERHWQEKEKYRQDMTDAGRGHLLGP